jgi:hypothetical protein
MSDAMKKSVVSLSLLAMAAIAVLAMRGDPVEGCDPDSWPTENVFEREEWHKNVGRWRVVHDLKKRLTGLTVAEVVNMLGAPLIPVTERYPYAVYPLAKFTFAKCGLVNAALMTVDFDANGVVSRVSVALD